MRAIRRQSLLLNNDTSVVLQAMWNLCRRVARSVGAAVSREQKTIAANSRSYRDIFRFHQDCNATLEVISTVFQKTLRNSTGN